MPGESHVAGFFGSSILTDCPFFLLAQPGELCSGDGEEQGENGGRQPAHRQGQRVYFTSYFF
jgi:hypothetical protein